MYMVIYRYHDLIANVSFLSIIHKIFSPIKWAIKVGGCNETPFLYQAMTSMLLSSQ
jgi:hypothetical protein